MNAQKNKSIVVGSKRVLVLCQHFWPESFRVNDLCDFLVDKECEIEVLCGIPNYPQGKYYDGYSIFKNRKQTHNGVKIRRAFEIPRGNNTNFRIFLNYISFPIASLFHIPILLTKKYDKILIYQLSPVMMSIAGIIVGKIKKIETTMYVLDLWPENLFSVIYPKSTLMRNLTTRLSHWHYKKVDKLVVLSQKMKDRLIAVTKIDPEKIIILPQACEKIYETEINDRQLSDRFKNTFNILFTGNLSPAQSFATMIKAAKILKGEKLSNIKWIIVGDGMSRKSLQKEVASSGLSDVFSFEGLKPIEDIPGYTAISNVLVGCLVKSELLDATIPAKVMSYLAAGKPIVLAMDGEVRSLINDTIKCGHVGPTENAQTLADNIKKIYTLSPSAQRDIGLRARKYHMKHFERNVILNKLFNFIFDINKGTLD